MIELWGAALTALWLGILTSISPCPLATNVAAISYIAREISSPPRVFAAGMLYTAGRALVYMALGVALVWGLLSAPGVSYFLQSHMNKILGPVLILAGMVLLGMLSFDLGGGWIAGVAQNRVRTLGAIRALSLGALFALSFCPVSAALFFGSLIPLSLQHGSGFLLPSLYGIATGLPVMVFALFIASGSNRLGRAFDALAVFERWARRVTGTVFILVGIYYSLAYIFGVPLF